MHIDPGFDEIQAGDLDGAPIEVYWAWEAEHPAKDRLPDGESLDDALRRYASALRRLLARTETVTLVVTHEHALHAIATAAAAGPSQFTGMPIANAAPYLIDERAARRAAASLRALALPGRSEPGRQPGGLGSMVHEDASAGAKRRGSRLSAGRDPGFPSLSN